MFRGLAQIGSGTTINKKHDNLNCVFSPGDNLQCSSAGPLLAFRGTAEDFTENLR